jgi:putative peptidoglycan lipid II flippase
MMRVGWNPILAIAIGTLVGGFAQAMIQWPSLRREGFHYRPLVDLEEEGLRQIGRLMGPGILGLAAVQINLFVNSLLATSQGTGAVSWLDYAFRLMYMPIGLFGVSIATAALPGLSSHAARENTAGMRDTISSSLRMMLMLNVPATMGLVALAGPIVRLIYEHGQFTSGDTASTAAALIFYAPGLVGYSAVKLFSPAFYALRESRTPVIVSGLTVGMNVILNVALVETLGYRGLALGTTLAALFNASALFWLLRNRLDGLEGRRVANALAKITVASLIMAIAARSSEAFLEGVLPSPSIAAQVTRVFGSIGVGVIVLAVSVRALRVQEFSDALSAVIQRFRRSKPSI